MTPIKDHTWISRRGLLNGPEEAKRLHYQALIKLGVSETEAANRAGWHPMVPVDRWLRRFGWTLVIGGIAGLLVLYASSTAANMGHRDKLEELKNLEHNVTWCMQGKPMKIGQEWFSCTCLSSDDPKGCPEEAK
jgi:hypothetical protein